MTPRAGESPTLPRVFACCFYDWLLGAAILFVAAALAVALNAGEAIGPSNSAFRLYLLAAAFPYFGYCWTHGGQTLGMRTWHVRLLNDAGEPISWQRAALRYVASVLSLAVLGLGFAWILVDRERRSWHDRLSGTHLELLADRKA